MPDSDSIPMIEAEALALQGQSRIETLSTPAEAGLVRASQVEREYAPDAPLAVTMAWIRSFLVHPHPQVGRPGPVCPFTPTALALDTIWLGEIAEQDMSVQHMVQLVGEYRDLFTQIEPRSGPTAINKTLLAVFPCLGEDAASMIDDVQRELKPSFVALGLMLGEFHAGNESPGLRNPDFRPLRSPVPMLAIRHMVESDLPFLRRSIDPPHVRGQYLRSYLRLLGATMRDGYFEQAIMALVEAEMQMRAAQEAQDDPVPAPVRT